MAWINELRDTVVGLDTAPLIYLIEEHPRWLPRVQPFFHALDQGVFRAVTSTITLTEVLVHPLRRSQPVLAEQYRQLATALEARAGSFLTNDRALALAGPLRLITLEHLEG